MNKPFIVSTGERFATLREANTFAIVHATPNCGAVVTMPSGGIMSLWDFRVWSTLAVRRLDGGGAVMSDTLTARPLGVDAVGDTHVRVDFGTNGDEMRPYAQAALRTVPGATRYEYKGMFLEKATGTFYGYFIVKGH